MDTYADPPLRSVPQPHKQPNADRSTPERAEEHDLFTYYSLDNLLEMMRVVADLFRDGADPPSSK